MTTKLNDTIIVKTNDEKCSYIVKAAYDQKLGKSRTNLKCAIGEPFGATYELNKRKLTRVDASTDPLDSIVDVQNWGEEDGEDGDTTTTAVARPPAADEASKNSSEGGASKRVIRGDNSTYVDTNTSQKITDADIQLMRERGLSGKEIISVLKENSSTFASKTDFAQAKWIKRKAAKYDRKVVVLKATPMTMGEVSFTRNKEKLGNMRQDSLAQVLAQSGVHGFGGSRVLVMDSTVGLAVGSLAYRMRGEGRIIALYGAQQPHFEIVNQFNLDAKSLSVIQPVAAPLLGPAARYVCKHGFHPPLSVEEEATFRDIAPPGTEVAGQLLGKDATTTTTAATVAAPDLAEDYDERNDKQLYPSNLNSTGRSYGQQKKIWYWMRQGVNSLVINCRFRPLPILKQALMLLQPSSPFVVFHEFIEPLQECYLFLQQQNSVALRLQLSENWLRDFQTLPGRFRPDMFMSTNGGYILTGIYVGTVVASGGGKPPYSLTDDDTEQGADTRDPTREIGDKSSSKINNNSSSI